MVEGERFTDCTCFHPNIPFRLLRFFSHWLNCNKKFNWKEVNQFLRERGVTLISAGLDEVPMACKNIREVMAAQNDLVTVLGQFDPKLVKMAPSGERPED
jgi:hypothetical protein